MVDMDPSAGLAALFGGGVNKTLCNKALRKPAKHLANPLVVVPAAGPRHSMLPVPDRPHGRIFY